MSALVDLSIGEIRVPLPPPIAEEIMSRLESEPMTYQPMGGNAKLRELIVNDLMVYGYQIPPDRISVTTGASMALVIALLASCTRGDMVLMPRVCFPGCVNLATALGLDVSFYDLGTDGIRPLGPLQRSPKAVLLNSPHNPTGKVVSCEEMEAVLSFCSMHRAILMSDEVYKDFIFNGRHIVPSGEGYGVPIFHIHSFSKSFAMTGWRLGFLVSPPSYTEMVDRVHYSLTMSAPSPAQYLASAFLRWPGLGEWRKRILTQIDQNRSIVCAALRDLTGLATDPPSGTFFYWIDIGASNWTSTSFVKLLLAQSNVLLADGAPFVRAPSTAVRVNLACADDDMGKAIGGIDRALKSISQRTRREATGCVS